MRSVRRRCVAVPRAALFGFNDDTAIRGAIAPALEAGLIAFAGASVERVPLAWAWIEPRRGQFDWSLYDGLYAAYRARGIRPLWAVQGPARGWAAKGSCPSNIPNCVLPPKPEYDGDWRRFLQLVAARYPGSAAIEVWNEPNHPLFWGGAPDPARYMQVLRLAVQGVRAAAPDMPVVTGGLAGGVGPGGIPATTFLRSLYRSGLAGLVDGIGYHPYPALPNVVRSLRTRVQGVRAVRDGAGDRGTPLWITETGASNVGQGGYPPFSEAAQADGLVSIWRTLSAMPDVEAVVFHRLVDEAPGLGLESGFGALRRDLSPKPAYCAIGLEWRRQRICG